MKLFRRFLILTHRYLGIVLSLLIVVWFASGIVMMYAGGMPRLTPQLRLERLPQLDVSRIRLTPSEAADRAALQGAPGRVVLSSVMERPAYRFGQSTEAYNLHLSYSKDNGKTWAPSFMPHHDGTKSQHGFASMFDLPGSGLGVVWLDGRNSEVFDDPETGTMELRFAAFDANWKQTADVEVDHRVCECCSTTAAVTSDGVLTAVRDLTPEGVRDIGVSRLENGRWTPTTIISKENWMIDFCPVNGPMLSARGRDVAAAWFTVKNDQGQAYAAFSSDAGRTWGAPIRLDDGGSLGRVDVEMLDDGSGVATWVEYAEGRSDFRLRRVDRSGARSAAITVAGVSGGRASGFPRVARRGDELVFAWSASAAPDGKEEGALQVYTAVAALP